MLKNVIDWISNRDNATLAIALAGLALSLLNIATACIKNRKSMEILVHDVFRSGPNYEGTYSEILNVTFVNKSREAITLSGLTIECDEKIQRFGEYRQMLLENRSSTNKVETSCSTWFSDILPQKVEGLGYAHALLLSTGKDICIKQQCPYVLTLYTNKGKIVRTFTNDIADINKLSECRAPDWHTEALKR